MSDMQRPSFPFFQRYLSGESSAEDIDEWIDAWHEQPDGRQIFEFLGMTEEEYSLWLCDPDSLAEIAQARRAERPLVSVVQSALVAMGQAGSPRSKQLRRWLARQAEAHPAK
jgi:hypothetical protein